jgi:hypothetical protein
VLNATSYNRQNIDPTGNISQLKRVDLGAVAAVNQWSVIGRWNYSLVDGKTLGVAGFDQWRLLGVSRTSANA